MVSFWGRGKLHGALTDRTKKIKLHSSIKSLCDVRVLLTLEIMFLE